MWQQDYTPVAHSLGMSALVAAIPILILLILLGVLRKPAWLASLAGLGTAMLVAGAVYGMPVNNIFASVTYGAAFGLFPIGWVVFCAILLYRVSLEKGQFEVLKSSIGHLTDDSRLQALLIAFAFGAFIEGAAGFGTPVAVAAAMLTGLGFSPFYAAGVCLLANTAPVAFGSIGLPIMTLSVTTGLPLDRLSAGVGRICAPVSLIVPAYLVVVMAGWRGLRAVLPAAALCGVAFAGTQFCISNFVSPQLTDILASMAAMGALIGLFFVWKPKDHFELREHRVAAGLGQSAGNGGTSSVASRPRHSGGQIALAWAPYAFLVLFVLLWGIKPLQAELNRVSLSLQWPGLHNTILRMPPVVPQPARYPAVFAFSWLSASGTACLFAAILGALVLGLTPKRFAQVFWDTVKQLALAELTLAAVLGLAFLMNYSGATATLGLAFAATGVLFPFFSPLLGWLGVFLTGSDTSSNALFGTLQVVTAHKLGMHQVLMASANSSGGVMGKMISLTSIAVAVCATEMKPEEEGKLFRFTLKHSVLLASIIGIIVLFYSYVAPSLAP
ncbi:MAG TPA: lactate permease LctP family transporter [Bryobacteraceae bacterium]|nr:lactate permease LctP family transporter [Bryobacteraceae bacterium]